MTNWDVFEFDSIGEAIGFIKAFEEDLENAEAEATRLRGLLRETLTTMKFASRSTIGDRGSEMMRESILAIEKELKAADCELEKELKHE